MAQAEPRVALQVVGKSINFLPIRSFPLSEALYVLPRFRLWALRPTLVSAPNPTIILSIRFLSIYPLLFGHSLLPYSSLGKRYTC